ncbi:hypothetical protein HYFRA_00000771 [Hymenoscyphus fraxineus]|uniref:Uncharacterized protein n=1 Tax=Hymenoscyphus fraxineus TaxID=746836 RepID=A0A9N9KTV7_9HELO|nr:hypothetical protein HYFRA_00000771 [Hymenoscyphus fraxineus]
MSISNDRQCAGLLGGSGDGGQYEDNIDSAMMLAGGVAMNIVSWNNLMDGVKARMGKTAVAGPENHNSMRCDAMRLERKPDESCQREVGWMRGGRDVVAG